MRKKQKRWFISAVLTGGAYVFWLYRQRQRNIYIASNKPLQNSQAKPTVEPEVVKKPTRPLATEPPSETEESVAVKLPSETEESVAIETPAEPKAEPETTSPAKSTVWQELEPDDTTDSVPHQVHQLLAGIDGWQFAGASRRGKMHAHQGTYREDAFAIDVAESWHIIAVSDGAGSCRLSRVGASLATKIATTTIKELLNSEPEPSLERLSEILDETLQAAHTAIHQEAEQRNLSVKEFSATFLLLVHRQVGAKHIIGSIQVGDGLMAIKYQNETIEPLAEKDSGAYGGETTFLTSRDAKAWQGRGLVQSPDYSPTLIAVMSDGVADDFIPYERYLPGLFDYLAKVVAREEDYQKGDVAESLLQLIGYEKRGSFDDRTLVILYQEPG